MTLPAGGGDLVASEVHVLVGEDGADLLEEDLEEVVDGLLGRVHGALPAVGAAAGVALRQEAGVAQLPGLGVS